jgi:hypothetical protein
VNGGFIASVDPVALYRIRTITKLNSIEDMSCSDAVVRYGAAIGRAESRVRDKTRSRIEYCRRCYRKLSLRSRRRPKSRMLHPRSRKSYQVPTRHPSQHWKLFFRPLRSRVGQGNPGLGRESTSPAKEDPVVEERSIDLTLRQFLRTNGAAENSIQIGRGRTKNKRGAVERPRK